MFFVFQQSHTKKGRFPYVDFAPLRGFCPVCAPNPKSTNPTYVDFAWIYPPGGRVRRRGGVPERGSQRGSWARTSASTHTLPTTRPAPKLGKAAASRRAAKAAKAAGRVGRGRQGGGQLPCQPTSARQTLAARGGAATERGRGGGGR